MPMLSEMPVRVMEISMPCRLGLHMRMAAHFFQLIKQFRSEIKIRKGNFSADARSILGVLSMGVTWRSKLRIEARGEDATSAINAIREYFSNSENCLEKAT